MKKHSNDGLEVAVSGFFVLVFIVSLTGFIVSTGHIDDWSKAGIEQGSR